MFLPALIFSSVIRTVNHAISSKEGTLQDIWVPMASAVMIFVASSIMTLPMSFFLREKEEFVRRAIWACLVLGNSTVLPLLFMDSICDSFKPLSTDPECLVHVTGFSSLYAIVPTIFTVSTSSTWQHFSYLVTSTIQHFAGSVSI